MTRAPVPIPGAFLIDPAPRSDERGYFARAFCARTFREWGLADVFPQANLSFSVKRGIIRGLHYQLPPAAEAKLVLVLRGRIQDVMVDLRKGSPTFLRWHSEVLSSDSRRMLYVPPGCAHGYQALEDQTEVYYFASAEYHPSLERQVNYKDPRLGIRWEEPNAILSAKDSSSPHLSAEFEGVDL
jgi:dTDP-4-dehydrorhamnose 3,5-epimerase